MNTKFENHRIDDKHQLTNIDDVKKFILAGNATFTLESTRTGKWFTYKVTKKEFKDDRGEVEKTFYFVSLLSGPDNDSDYRYLGTISPKFYVNTTAKSKISKDAISFKALSFFVSYLRKGELHNEINIYHEGVCGKCGKKLTTPDSVATGLGPICKGYDNPTKVEKKSVRNIRRILKRD